VTSTSLPSRRRHRASVSGGRIRDFATTFGAELVSLGLIGAGLALFLARLGQVSGAKLLFYNSDSLTMPLFARALSAPEGLGWTSGPFLGVFPELPTYLLADALTSTPRSALVVCGFLNIFLYLAMRLLAGVCGGSTKVRRQAAVAGIVLVTLGMAAETFQSSEWNLGWMLFSSTYYVGISTMGVVTVALVARMLSSSRPSPGTSITSVNLVLPPVRLSAALFGVSLLTTISNPMFSVVIAVPCAAAMVVFAYAHRCSVASAGVASGSLLGGTVLGYVLQPFLGMVGASVEGYFHWDRMGRTAEMVLNMAKSLLDDPFGSIELVVLVSIVLVALIQTARMVLRRGSSGVLTTRVPASDSVAGSDSYRDSDPHSTGRHFVTFFVASWIILAPLALIVTGPGVTRYFGTLAVFPFLMVVANYSLIAEQIARKKLRRGNLLAGTIVAVLGFGAFPSARATASLAPPAEIACVSATVPRGSSGIAEFWTARPIDIFNTANARVLQASSDLGISGWISNPAEFKGRNFTFVLTSWKENYKRIRPISAETLAPLGAPSRITHCGELDVYEYWAGSPGHTKLNEGLKYAAG
jgi:hypothetical protein